MKIIQIIAAVNGESPGHFESQLLGLGDDGGLYAWEQGGIARARFGSFYLQNETTIKKYQEEEKHLTFVDGSTCGWRLLCMSFDMTKTIPHPLDPTRHDRS